jgi:predicted DNA-binding transcriptional regulator YafY
MATTSQKAFCVLSILKDYSDEDHPLNATQICGHLKNYGIETERRSVYRSIQGLEKAGYDIISSGPEGWFLGREFDTAEIKILMDAVQQAHFLTYHKSMDLINKILDLTSINISRELKKQISISRRPKYDNELIYYNVDKINTATVKNKKIAFNYFDYDIEGRRVFRKNRKTYTASPYFTTWFNENYYMIAITADYDNFSHYRIERMSDISILDEPRRNIKEIAPDGFDLADYLNKAFSMFTGTPEKVSLKIKNELANHVFDRFGSDTRLIPAGEGWSKMTIDAVADKGLISWIISFGENIRVLHPGHLKDEILDHCSGIIGMYE